MQRVVAIAITSLMAIKEHDKPFRCKACNKLLGKPNNLGAFLGQVKCPRCGRINER